jgi:hypothetical protein
MRRILLPVFLIIFSLTLVGCGNSSTSNTSAQSTAEAQPLNIKSDFVFMSEFVSALQSAGVSCADYVKKSEPSILTKDEGSCTFGDSTIYLALFGDSKTTPELVESLKGFGGYFLTSNNWVINVEDETIAKELQTLLGVSVL